MSEPAPTAAPLTRLPEFGLGGRRKRRPERHDEILLAGVRLFNERGYHATSIEEIAKVVEISPTTVYRHFRNKQEILDTAALWISDQLWERLSAEPGDLPPHELLLDYVDNLVGVACDLPDFVVLATRESQALSPHARAVWSRRRHELADQWSLALVAANPGMSRTEADLRIHLGISLICALPTYRGTRGPEAPEVARRALLGALGVDEDGRDRRLRQHL
jgi:AcrR family transcriptional regulator